MLAIRLQRHGRKDYPVYRIAVQEAHRHPLSGRVVAYVGTYNPHTKDTKVQVEVAQRYLDNGAQPSPRVVKLLETAGVKLPSWVKKFDSSKVKQTKKSDKLRKNQPKEAAAPAPEAPAVVEAEPVVETPEVETTPEVTETPSEK